VTTVATAIPLTPMLPSVGGRAVAVPLLLLAAAGEQAQAIR
jgi:hypothetical protein